MKFDICCVGHMCTDILVRPVDALPEKGKLMLVDSIHQYTGGCAMNTAISLAKLGVNTALVGKVGNDGFGAFMKATLEENQVDTGGLLMEEGGMTSASVVTIGTDGERTILHCLGTNQSLCFEDITINQVLCARYLFIGGVFLMPKFDGEDTAGLLKIAQENGVVTAMDTAWDAQGRWLELIRPSLAHLDWFMPSVEEAEQMLGTRDPEKLTGEFKKLGVKNVVIKLGSDGCYVAPQGEEGRCFGVFPAKAVDTAGAGDAWCAGFLAGLIRNLPVDEAALLGNAAGAMCVTKIGTTNGIRCLEETQAFIRRYMETQVKGENT